MVHTLVNLVRTVKRNTDRREQGNYTIFWDARKADRAAEDKENLDTHFKII